MVRVTHPDVAGNHVETPDQQRAAIHNLIRRNDLAAEDSSADDQRADDYGLRCGHFMARVCRLRPSYRKGRRGGKDSRPAIRYPGVATPARERKS
jgi:hypothetical protein